MRLVLILALHLMAFVCDQSHAPVVQNTMEQPIELYVEYSNGQSLSGEFPPGATIWSPAKGIGVDRVEVRRAGKLLFQLGKDDLKRLRFGLATGSSSHVEHP